MTQCSRCGDCCENIYCSVTDQKIDTYTSLDSRPDPAIDDNWAEWRNAGFQDEDRQYWTDIYNNPNDRNRLDTNFIKNNWVRDPNRESIWSCKMFDKKTRLCTAHESRPPICIGFPWYDDGPVAERRIPGRCSFHVDVPGRANLPIVAIS